MRCKKKKRKEKERKDIHTFIGYVIAAIVFRVSFYFLRFLVL